MQYLLLIYDDEAMKARMPEKEKGAFFQDYIKFTQSIRESGAFQAGAPLQPTSTATTVRAKNGKALTSDGPYAETKEQLGGYYLIDAKNLDEALAIAGRIPSVRIGGAVEVRPLMQMG